MNDLVRVYIEYWSNLLRFEGRTGRRKFWITVLVVAVTGTLIGILCRHLGAFGRAISGIYFTLSTIPSISLLWRRMHDTGREGWWGLIPLLNLIFALNDSDTDNRYGPVPRD